MKRTFLISEQEDVFNALYEQMISYINYDYILKLWALHSEMQSKC